MARPKERSLNGRECGVLEEGISPPHQLRGLRSAAVSSPYVGSAAKPWRPTDLELLQDFKAASGVDFANIKFLSVKFSCGSEPQQTPTTKVLWGFGPLYLDGIGA